MIMVYLELKELEFRALISTFDFRIVVVLQISCKVYHYHPSGFLLESSQQHLKLPPPIFQKFFGLLIYLTLGWR